MAFRQSARHGRTVAGRGRKSFPPAQHHGMFDGGPQFTDVAGPRMIYQQLECVPSKIVHCLAVLGGELAQKLLRQQRMSPVRSRNGGRLISTTRKRKNRSSRNFPALTCSSRFLFVAAINRTSAVRVLFEPTRSKVRSPESAAALPGWSRQSRQSHPETTWPPCACSNRPMRRSCAPVNAPRSCPNNSLSSRVADSAAQCTVTIGCFARGLN